MRIKKPIKFASIRNSDEIWICEDFSQRKRIDGHEFIFVHKPDQPNRKFWINLNGLVKAK